MDDDTAGKQSADDALEPRDDIFNPQLDEERLSEDNDSPAAAADDTNAPKLPSDDPRTDSGLDEDEVYQEGVAEAAGAEDNEVVAHDEPRPLDPEDE